MSALPTALLPENAHLSSTGALQIAGCEVTDLAQQFGTPLFIYDEDHMITRCRQAMAAFGENNVAYAAKAFLCRAMARLVHAEGLHIDVSSAGELALARSAGVPATRLVMHGNNKSLEELRLALTEGVGRIVVDNATELDRLEYLHRETGRRAPVLIRATPGVGATTHHYITTGQENTKFGFSLKTGDASRAIEHCRSSAAFDFHGLHAHIGSQMFDIEPFRQALRVLAGAAIDHDITELSVGGGFGVPYVVGETAPTFADWGNTVREVVAETGLRSRVTVEPGRAIAASAAITVYRIGAIKPVLDANPYVVCDGGYIDNPRPALYGSGYETFLPRATHAERPQRATLVGKHCESGDVLVRDGLFPEDIRVDDYVATPVTGAYGRCMGSTYNLMPRPAVVFVRDGNARLVMRRESLDDLFATDCG